MAGPPRHLPPVLLIKPLGHCPTRHQPPAAKAVEPGKPIPPAPFRVATNGLAGRQFIDPISSGPIGWGSMNRAPRCRGPPRTPSPGSRRKRRSATRDCRCPDTCVKSNSPSTRAASMMFCLGDPWNASHLNLVWNPEREMIECLLQDGHHGGWGWNGSRDFAPERRISLKLVVGDGRQTLFHENNRISSVRRSGLTDCCLRIWSETPDSAVIHRCSLRPLTEQDVAACGWTTPPTELPFKAGDAAARLAKISEGYPSQPKPRREFRREDDRHPDGLDPARRVRDGDRGIRRTQSTKGGIACA